MVASGWASGGDGSQQAQTQLAQGASLQLAAPQVVAVAIVL